MWHIGSYREWCVSIVNRMSLLSTQGFRKRKNVDLFLLPYAQSVVEEKLSVITVLHSMTHQSWPVSRSEWISWIHDCTFQSGARHQRKRQLWRKVWIDPRGILHGILPCLGDIFNTLHPPPPKKNKQLFTSYTQCTTKLRKCNTEEYFATNFKHCQCKQKPFRQTRNASEDGTMLLTLN